MIANIPIYSIPKSATKTLLSSRNARNINSIRKSGILAAEGMILHNYSYTEED